MMENNIFGVARHEVECEFVVKSFDDFFNKINTSKNSTSAFIQVAPELECVWIHDYISAIAYYFDRSIFTDSKNNEEINNLLKKYNFNIRVGLEKWVL